MTKGSLILLSYSLSLGTTFVIEVPLIYYLFKFYGHTKNHTYLKAGCIAQLITHPAFFLVLPTLVLFIDLQLNLGKPLWIKALGSFVLYEFLIPIVEGWFYNHYLKPAETYKAYLFSIIANLASWGLGALIDDLKIAMTLLGLQDI